MRNFVVDTNPTPKESSMSEHTASSEARSEPVLTVEIITPEIAQQWLESYNTENRGFKTSAVNKYVRDIESGNWAFLGDPIRFDVRGILIDGQHRLRAIVKSGIAIQMVVLRGVKTSHRAVIDSGARRSSGDALRIEGRKNAVAMAAAVSALDAFERGLFKHSGSSPMYSPSHAEVVELADLYSELGFDDDVTKAVSDYKHIRIKTTTLAVSRYLQRQVATDKEVEEFWYGACFTAGPGDARWTLRNWAAKQSSTRKDARRDTSLGLYAVAVCWNAWRKGKNTRISPVEKKEVLSDTGRVVKPAVYREIPRME